MFQLAIFASAIDTSVGITSLRIILEIIYKPLKLKSKFYLMTPLSITLVLFEVFLIFTAVNHLYFDDSAGKAYGGALYGMGVVFNSIAIVFHQIIARKFENVKLFYVYESPVVFVIFCLAQLLKPY